MNLEKYALVTQGAFLARVQTLPSPESVKLPLYTMREMNEWLSPESNAMTDVSQEVFVSKDRLETLPIAKEGWVLISLTGQKAVAMQKEHVGKLIPSNFAIIEPSEQLLPDYLEWFINEHPDSKKQLRIATQGSTISALSIQMLRTLEINLPPMNVQVKIGNIHRLLHRKNRLLQEKLMLEHQYAKHIMMGYLKEELK